MNSVFEFVLFFILLIITVFFSFKIFRKKYKLIQFGKDISRADKPVKRLLFTVRNVLLQFCTIKNRPITGIFHSSMFWGFIVFGFITLNHVYEGFFTGKILYGNGFFYKALVFLANVFVIYILIGVVYFILRRYVFKIKSLERPSYQSLIILIFISVLMLSFVFYEFFKGYSGNIESYNFLANFIKANLSNNMSESFVEIGKSLMWWIHILIIFAFAVFIPYSKHLHLVAGPLNIFFKNNRHLAEIPVEDLEELEKFGTVKINDLTKKDMLDLFSCAECGRCDDVCPAVNSGKSLSPRDLLSKLKDNLIESHDELVKKGENLKTLLGEVVSDEEVWDCTTCGACLVACPMFNEHVTKITGIRQYAVLMESKFPEEFNVMYRGIENQGNPWGIGSHTRGDWAKGLDIPLLSEKGETDILLWVGCEGSFDVDAQKNTVDFVKILKKAGVNFAILGNEETCCGDPLRRTGNEYMFQMLAMQNIETLNKYKFNKIVTMCPHGLYVLKNEYPLLDGNYEILHYTELIDKLIKEDKIKIEPVDSNSNITYHDPCYIGRYDNNYNIPRELIKKTGAKLIEMEHNKDKSFCCGAGGGGMWKEEGEGDRISHIRLKEAEKTDADTLITACPFCATMFKDAKDETGSDKLITKDLIQLIKERIKD